MFPFGKLNLTPKQLQNNPDLKAHGLRVMETIGTAVEGLQDIELIVAILMDLGERHSMYGAKPEHFSVNLIWFFYLLYICQIYEFYFTWSNDEMIVLINTKK